MRHFIARFQFNLLLGLVLTSLSGATLRAQFIQTPLHLMSPEYEIEASRLRSAAPQQYDFSKAMLSDVLRFLATDAGISFFSLPDDSADGSRLITFSIKSSPFQVLETLCKANGLAILPDNGIWYIRPADDRELIGKSYEIKNNAVELVERVSSGTGSSSTRSSGGGGGVSGAAVGMDLQGTSQTFAVKRSEVINDIRTLLGLPPEESDGGQSGGGAPGLGGSGTDENAARAMNSNELSAVRKPKVIWKSDSNTLYIVATRLQHLWVEGYIAAADKPQTLIAIEVKFIETSRDPSREFGIDWSSTLGSGGNARQVTNVTSATDATTGLTTNTVNYNNVATTGGYATSLANLLTGFNMNNVGSTLGFPATSVLSAQDVNVKLRALMQDQETNTTSYPRMVTLSNREVAIRAVVNQPVLDASSSASSGSVGATTTTKVAYLPIGTVLNILPKRMQADKVLLNMAVTVSSIIGTQVISGNPYPIASSRVYSAPVEIESGYTVAVGGLDEATEKEAQTGVPFLSKIPGLKWLFDYKSRSKNHKSLMLFITPTIIDARLGGLPVEPQSVVPQRPHLPGKPKIDTSSGALIGGSAALPRTVEYLSREAEILGNTVKESRITPELTQKLKELKIAVERVESQCENMKLSEPAKFAMIDQHQQMLRAILKRLESFQRILFNKKYL